MNILGVNLNKNKNIVIEITKIYGIGIKTAKKICKNIQIQKKKVKELNEKEFIKLNKKLRKKETGENLKKKIIENIKNLIKINCYRGIRHKKKLPVRGQRTRTNAKTIKKIKLI